MSGGDKSDPKPDLDPAAQESSSTAIRKDLWLHPAVFYEDLDEAGNNRRMPPSLRREFAYEPNILSEQLVRFQRFLHKNHQTIDHYLECAISGLFWSERQLFSLAEWTRRDAPHLVWPTTQVASLSMLAYTTNRFRSPAGRIFMTTGMGLLTGFLVYPSWGREAARLANKHIVEPIGPVRAGLDSLTRAYNGTVNAMVRTWEAGDDAASAASASLARMTSRIVSIFKPGKPPQP